MILFYALENGVIIATQSDDVAFSTYDVQKTYYNDAGGYSELDLKLPLITGTYRGISEINEYFVSKEDIFYNDLPVLYITDDEPEYYTIKGKESGHFRSAYYRLEVVFGHIISISADLDGGLDGIGWEGKEGHTFDLTTGKRLSLSDLFSTGQDTYMDAIYNSVSKTITDNINNEINAGCLNPYWFEDAYSENGCEIIRENFSPEDFYLTHDSLAVFYEKYALTCNAEGPEILYIPFESIMDILAYDIREPLIHPSSAQDEPSYAAEYYYMPWPIEGDSMAKVEHTGETKAEVTSVSNEAHNRYEVEKISTTGLLQPNSVSDDNLNNNEENAISPNEPVYTHVIIYLFGFAAGGLMVYIFQSMIFGKRLVPHPTRTQSMTPVFLPPDDAAEP